MRRYPGTFVIAASLALSVLAGQASAGQARPRSAPPTSGSREQGSSQQSQGDRGGSQRRETPSQPQASRPSNDRQSNGRPSNDRPSNDARGNTGVRGGDAQRDNNRGREQGRPSTDNRVGRDDNRSNSGGRFDNNRSVGPRQAVPAPRDRYVDLNRNGRDDRFDRGRFNYPYRDYRYSSRYAPRYGFSSSYRYNDYRYGGRVYFSPYRYQRFSSAWFSFRPFSRLSIGLTMGYPVAFPSWYDARIVGPSGFSRPTMAYGGVTFDIEPRDADLWVDGEYVGPVSDYTSYDPPLTLVAGRHHIELATDDDRALEFDVTVVSGQVIPYQGSLPYVR